jgi:hypothetical protein
LSTTTKVPRRGVGTYVLGAHVVLPCQADPRASLRSFAAYRTRTPAVLATLSSGGTPQLTRPPKNADPFEPRRVCPASSLLKRTPYTYCYSSIKCNCCSCHHHAKACAEGFGPNPSAQAALHEQQLHFGAWRNRNSIPYPRGCVLITKTQDTPGEA